MVTITDQADGARNARFPQGMRGFATALAGLVSIASIPAAAQNVPDTYYFGGQGSTGKTIEIPVTASVGGRCEFATGGAPSGSYDAGQIDAVAWSNRFDFQISCNTASRVAVVSTNGGLKTAAAVADPGYTGLAPYDVTLNLDGNVAVPDATATCPVATLKAGAGGTCGFIGPASSSQGLRLTGPSTNQINSYLFVSAPAYTGSDALIAGSYTDTLTVTIAAAP